MLDTIFGLPLHPLIVHATVVAVPAAALATLLAAVWPRFRARAGIVTPVLALIAVVLTPLSTSSGEALQGMVGNSKLIEEHSELADMLIYWVVPLLIGAAGVWWLTRQGTRVKRGLFVAAAAVSVIAALGTTVQVVLIGHSGAKSAWGDVASSSNAGGSSDGD
ncbi:MAG: DUF2231 domain-containing protein [Nocardioides sp.]